MTEKSNQSLGKRGNKFSHVFDRSIIILLIVYVLVLLYHLFNRLSDGYYSNYYYDEEINRNLSIITFAAGLLVSFIQFRFLQIKTKCITTLSFGQSRKSLFRKKFWFPLLIMSLTTISYYIILLFADDDLNKFFYVLKDEYFANILIALLPLWVGYTVGAFARIMCGKTSETIAFGASVCAFPFTAFSFIDTIFALSLRGYYVSNTEYYGISNNYSCPGGNPVTTVLSLFDPLYTLNYNVYGFNNTEASTLVWFETPAFYIIKNIVWLILTVGAIFLIESHFVNKFKAETCDKLGKSRFVRIVSSVTASLFVSMLTFWEFYSLFSGDAQSFIMLPLLILVLILALIITLVITAVLYRKKEQLPFSFIGVGVTAAFSVVVYLVSVTGCFGYSTYMPDTDKIKSVMINDPVGILGCYSPDYVENAYETLEANMCFETKEEIEIVKDVHKFIADDKACDTVNSFTVIYELENGSLIYRNYQYLSLESCEKIGTLYETDTVHKFYETIFNQNAELNSNSGNGQWFDWEMDFAFNHNNQYYKKSYYYYESYNSYDYLIEYDSYKTIAQADSLVIFSKDDKIISITDEEIAPATMEALKWALYKDYTSLSYQQYFKPENQIGVISLASCATMKEYEKRWLDDGYLLPTSEEVLYEKEDLLHKFSITADMVNTISVLKNAGLYEYFSDRLDIEDAHIIDSSKYISWQYSNVLISRQKNVDKDGKYLSTLIWSWDDDFNIYDYLGKGCGYLDIEDDEEDDWYHDEEIVAEPISESDIEKITPEEAEKLREKAFMTYNAGNDCKLLVMKYTDGTANMLVIPE